jgi:hypothetical protein
LQLGKLCHSFPARQSFHVCQLHKCTTHVNLQSVFWHTYVK